uniref:Acyltransferase 3 domain-containing protein n=1 Tax=Amphora coffeiformis TaxID=265554 RepID=A0A7S3KZ90_9STRA|mmetsp:Transcript_4205/g.8515  ORF Transcript_4205/g.8515 Transcript_4205/m.8515 type:complete len:423 (+) Transcript_4205:467-1735(+)
MQQLRSLHYLRGAAVTLVVAAHVQSMWKALLPGDNRFHHMLLVFLHGGAIGVFFVLAGFLFHHQHVAESSMSSLKPTATSTLDKRGQMSPTEMNRPLPVVRIQTKSQTQGTFDCFDSTQYIKRRFVKLGVPYLLICTPVLLRRIFLEEEQRIKNQSDYSVLEEDAQFGLVWTRTLSSENLQRILLQLCNGRDVIYAYWFIPVMLGLTLLSPLVAAFLRCSSMTQAGLLVFSYLLALVVVGRPSGNNKPQTWQLLLYFWPVYLTGAFLSVHRESAFKKGGEWITLGILCVILLGQIEFGSEVAGHVPLVANGLGLLQLLWTCWWAFVVTQKYNKRRLRPLFLHLVAQRLADASLEIYLLHPWVIAFVTGLVKDWEDKDRLMRLGCFVWAFETSVVLVVCFGLSIVWRWMVGKFRFQRVTFGRG